MAGTTSVTVRILSNRLPAVSSAIGDAAVIEVKRAGFEIEAAAKAKAPVRTGLLRRSIHTVFSDGGRTAKVGPSVEYSVYVEMGTRYRAARPFMRPAAALVYPRFVDRMKAAMRSAT